MQSASVLVKKESQPTTIEMEEHLPKVFLPNIGLSLDQIQFVDQEKAKKIIGKIEKIEFGLEALHQLEKKTGSLKSLGRLLKMRRNGWRINLYVLSHVITQMALPVLGGYTAYSTYLAMRDVVEQKQDDDTWSSLVGHVAEWGVQTVVVFGASLYGYVQLLRESRYLLASESGKEQIDALSSEVDQALTQMKELQELSKTVIELEQKQLSEKELKNTLMIARQEVNQTLDKMGERCYLPKPSFLEAHLDPNDPREKAWKELSHQRVMVKGYKESKEKNGTLATATVGVAVPIFFLMMAVLSAWGAQLVAEEAAQIRNETGRQDSVFGHTLEWSYNSVAQVLLALEIWREIYFMGKAALVQEIEKADESIRGL